jgi:superfamily II DNA/RNA helicase
MDFNEIKVFPNALLENIRRNNFPCPTPIQSQG